MVPDYMHKTLVNEMKSIKEGDSKPLQRLWLPEMNVELKTKWQPPKNQSPGKKDGDTKEEQEAMVENTGIKGFKFWEMPAQQNASPSKNNAQTTAKEAKQPW